MRVRAAAEALGTLLDCFDVAWFLGPGSAEIWSTDAQSNDSTSAYLDCFWNKVISDRVAKPDCRGAFYARDQGDKLYKSLTRNDGWHADYTVVNANRLGRYVLNVFSVMSLISRVGRMLGSDPENYSGCEPRLKPFSKGDLEQMMREYAGQVPPIEIPQPRVETTCRMAPILLEQAHLKEALQQPLDTKERGVVEGDAQAHPGYRNSFEVVKFTKEELHDDESEVAAGDIGGPPPTPDDLVEKSSMGAQPQCPEEEPEELLRF